eukprot:1328947-Pyramimonas_sp.AAC.1
MPVSGCRLSPARPSSTRVRLQRKAPMTTRSTCRGETLRAAQAAQGLMRHFLEGLGQVPEQYEEGHLLACSIFCSHCRAPYPVGNLARGASVEDPLSRPALAATSAALACDIDPRSDINS